MVVETVPRGTAGPGRAAWNERVVEWLRQELAAV